MTSQGHLVILAAGGTAGHVFPAEALAEELAGRGCRLALITDRRGVAFKGALEGIEIHRIRAGGIAGKSFAARLQSGPELAIGTWQARGLLKRLKPKAVMGFGGYASVPTMLAASFGGYQTAIHEQNVVLGRANRLLASRVDRIATSYVNSKGLPTEAAAKVKYTGMPVRASIAALGVRPYPALTADGAVSLLVIGGSQGAHVFSGVVPDALGRLDEGLRARVRVSQQCRLEDLDQTRDHYQKLGIDADLETPVSAYLKVARPPYSFLLESVEGGERMARYSFIGTEPYQVLKTGKGQPEGAVELADARGIVHLR